MYYPSHFHRLPFHSIPQPKVHALRHIVSTLLLGYSQVHLHREPYESPSQLVHSDNAECDFQCLAYFFFPDRYDQNRSTPHEDESQQSLGFHIVFDYYCLNNLDHLHDPHKFLLSSLLSFSWFLPFPLIDFLSHNYLLQIRQFRHTV